MKKWKLPLGKDRKGKTETWILLLLAGILLLVIALPTDKKTETTGRNTESSSGQEAASSASKTTDQYVRAMEKRVEELLSSIEGAGKVEVMLTVESAGEVILQTDEDTEAKSERETDSAGGVGTREEQSRSSQTVLTGSGNLPYVTKELCPKVTGIVVAAEGGDNAAVKAEISEAMEALFDVPAHKIKVLKRIKEES